MNADETAAGIARRSRIGRIGQRAVARLRADAGQSAFGTAFAALRAHSGRLTRAEKFRLAGVSIVTAIATNALLLQWSPPITKPAAPPLLSVIAAATGLALIVLAEPIARAWERSWIRRQLIRARGSNAADGGHA